MDLNTTSRGGTPRDGKNTRRPVLMRDFRTLRLTPRAFAFVTIAGARGSIELRLMRSCGRKNGILLRCCSKRFSTLDYGYGLPGGFGRSTCGAKSRFHW